MSEVGQHKWSGLAKSQGQSSTCSESGQLGSIPNVKSRSILRSQEPKSKQKVKIIKWDSRDWILPNHATLRVVRTVAIQHGTLCILANDNSNRQWEQSSVLYKQRIQSCQLPRACSCYCSKMVEAFETKWMLHIIWSMQAGDLTAWKRKQDWQPNLHPCHTLCCERRNAMSVTYCREVCCQEYRSGSENSAKLGSNGVNWPVVIPLCKASMKSCTTLRDCSTDDNGL